MKYFKLHHSTVNVNDATVYCTENPYAFDEHSYLHFISDVPHLLKTSRWFRKLKFPQEK